MTPYLHSLFDFLRPELDFQKKISEANEIIIFKIVSNKDLEVINIPKGFIIFKEIKTSPTEWVYKKNDSLFILIPQKCID